jgi:hypothetical protein
MATPPHYSDDDDEIAILSPYHSDDEIYSISDPPLTPTFSDRSTSPDSPVPSPDSANNDYLHIIIVSLDEDAPDDDVHLFVHHRVLDDDTFDFQIIQTIITNAVGGTIIFLHATNTTDTESPSDHSDNSVDIDPLL